MKKDTKTIPPGKIVDVNGHNMHVFSQGEGEATLVFMAGSGTSYPTLDFKPLWSQLSDHHKIVVVEKAGYGWSEATQTSRDIDTMLDETRKALQHAEIQIPYILVPHSMSGLEAIYWSQKYPNEVKAIIGLDAAIPEFYEIMKLPSAIVLKAIALFTRLGLHKVFSAAICKKLPAVSSTYLTDTEIEEYREAICRSTLSSDMVNEVEFVKGNAQKVKNGTVPSDLPVYFFISNGKDIGIKEWNTMLVDYSSKLKNGKYLQLDCGHYLHAYEPKKIASEIMAFIKDLA